MSRGNEYPLEYGYAQSEPVVSERAAFIRRTYAHLAGAILAFIGIEALLLQIPAIYEPVLRIAISPLSALPIFIVFVLVSALAQHWASSQTSRGVQYLGLAVYVVLQAFMILPMLVIAAVYAKDPHIIPTAGILTLAVFGGLTLVVFTTKKDFSFLGSLLGICSLCVVGFILSALLFGFSLGIFFVSAVIMLMACYILYHTSNVMLHYGTEQYVAASLALFACIATLFYYILWFLLEMSSNRN